MKTFFVLSALGLAVSLSGAPAYADQQATGGQVDNALNWAEVGGRSALHGARAEFIHHRRYRGSYDMVDPPAGSGGSDFLYGPGRAPYTSEGGSTLDFQLEGR